MPGHKLGKGIPAQLLNDIALLDLTEIPGTDNLHQPTGVIRDAQYLAAEAFGADETFFLVNGSTCGIHTMIMTVCKPGDKLVVSRDCHKSVINGMMLAGVNPVYINPEYNEDFGITSVIDPTKLNEVLLRNKEVKGVFITRPNYYGICSDIKKIASITHSFGKVLIVDEAHGAHFKFSNLLPLSAMEAGADICVQSAHKTLPAFTQGAYLHVKSQRIDMDRLKFNLRILQTSSPSYIIMAMLDIAREIMQQKGEKLLIDLLQNIEWFVQAVAGNDKFILLDDNNIPNGNLDRTRVVVNVKKAGITGYSAERKLRKDYNIQVEMSDFYNIVCITTIADDKKKFERLYSSLSGLAANIKDKEYITDICIGKLKTPQQHIELAGVMHAQGIREKLDKAAGKVCKDIITPYPPGVPVICPGEIITEEVVEYLYNIIKCSGNVNGIDEDFGINVVV